MKKMFSDIDSGYFHIKKNYMFESAKKHLRATKIGRPLYPKIMCPCCKKNTNKEDFTMQNSFDDYCSIGIGYSLFFCTLKYLNYFFYFLTLLGLFFLTFQYFYYGLLPQWINQNWFVDEVFFWVILMFFHWI